MQGRQFMSDVMKTIDDTRADPADSSAGAPPAQGNDSSSPALEEVRSKLAALEGELRRTREELAASETRRRIQQALSQAGAADLETATLVVESVLKQEPALVQKLGDKAVSRVIEDLRRRKPLLFRTPAVSPTGAMPLRPPPTGSSETPLAQAAEEAVRLGDRNSLLRYLRLKRNRD
jgi:hypothetical protein